MRHFQHGNVKPERNSGAATFVRVHLMTNSAGNALSHGLTAAKFLPQRLARLRDYYQDALRGELGAASVLENVLVDEMARHAAGMEFAAEAEEAALRNGVRQSEMAKLMLQPGITADPDAAISTALTSPAALQAYRHRRGHERGFHLALATLQELRGERAEPPQRQPIDGFTDEDCCLDYLLARLKSDSWRCPNCGGTGGYWLAERQRRECSACRAQIGVRSGTVLERSRLPLTTWFQAIIALLCDPSVSCGDLQAQLGITRTATARALRTKILAAMKLPFASRLLVGLPSICRRTLPEPGGAISPILQNGGSSKNPWEDGS
jgi:hypothetical protein